MTVNLPGQQESDSSSRTVAERLMPLLPIGLAMFTLSALLYYHLRHDALDVQSPLQLLVAWVYRSFGFAPAFLGFLLLLTWGSIWFVTGACERPLARLGRLFAMVVMLGVFLNLGDGGVSPAFHKGELGAWLGGVLVATIGYYPSLIAVWAITVAALLLATDFFFRDAFERLRESGRGEAGVEAEVTDHLKGLAASSLQPRPSSATAMPRTVAGDAAAGVGGRDRAQWGAAAVAGAAANDAADVGDEVVPEVFVGVDDDEVEVQPEVEDVEAQLPASPSRRVSYFERRREAPPLDEEDGGWVPRAPENQDIDNPEIETEAPTATAGADAVVADEVDDEQEIFVVDEQVDEVDEQVDEHVGRGDPGVPRSLAADWFGEGLRQGREESIQPGAEDVRGDVEDDEARAEPAPETDANAASVGDLVPESTSESWEPPVALSRPEPLAAIDGPGSAWGERAADAADEQFADEDALEEALDEDALDEEPDAGKDPVDVPRTARVTDESDREVEPTVSIPRLSTPPQVPARQQRLFGEQLDETLVEDATRLVLESRRATAAMLQRKLRVEFDTARQLLAELARRGILELDEDAVQGRLLR